MLRLRKTLVLAWAATGWAGTGASCSVNHNGLAAADAQVADDGSVSVPILEGTGGASGTAPDGPSPAGNEAGSAGRAGTGGAVAAGGRVGTGGLAGSGGVVGTGGGMSTGGGAVATGGMPAAATGGNASTGGGAATGGASGTAGTIGAAGAVGTGGQVATGGRAGGGAAGTTGGGTGGHVGCGAYPVGAQSFTTPTDNRAHCYWFHLAKQTWPAARTQCQNEHGDLVTILSDAENEFVRSIAVFTNSPPESWLGGTDGKSGNDTTGTAPYRWVTSELWSYAHWHQNEPDGFCDPCNNGNPCTCDHRATLASDGTWYDFWQDNARAFVCEATP